MHAICQLIVTCLMCNQHAVELLMTVKESPRCCVQYCGYSCSPQPLPRPAFLLLRLTCSVGAASSSAMTRAVSTW